MLMKLNPFANAGIAPSATPVSTALDELFRDTDRLLESAFLTPSAWINGPALPAADFEETPDALVLTMDLPGYDPKTLDLQVDGDVLTIRAERGAQPSQKGTWLSRERFHGRIARSFVLPRTVDASKCEARAEHGVLTVTIPKREEAKRRSIAVTVKS
jgi:HSP20 family protein